MNREKGAFNARDVLAPLIYPLQNVQMSAPIMSRFDLFFILVDDANEVTDYAIARRIVDLHSKLEESVDRVYQPEDVRRYLGFARLFKPKITIEAMDFLVEQYRHLRQRDSGGGVKSSWRITVRQLESMIRLAESMARMHCSDQVNTYVHTSCYKYMPTCINSNAYIHASPDF